MSTPAATGIARRSAERAARESYGKLVAILAARTRDVAAAEDALAEAFRIALQVWPERGVPDHPEAWLLTTARRKLGHDQRHHRVRDAAVPTLELMAPAMNELDVEAIRDDRLALLFICAHPAIDPAIQAPLMLQTVLGLDAARIAASFLTSPATMGQRLVRAKAKIRDAGIAFQVPGIDELPGRLDAVLAAIYAAYGTGWEDALGSDPRRQGLAEESIWLARVLVGLMPEAAEAKGLLALMLYCEARRPARRSRDGRFTPLDAQDPKLWIRDMIVEAETLLTDAARAKRVDRFQIEAAIQSVHIQRGVTGQTNWPALVALYETLSRLSPTIGVAVAKAAVIAESGAPATALLLLERLTADIAGYQPYWAARGRVLTLLGRHAEARKCYETAAGLSEDQAVRDFLLARGATCS